MLSSVDGRGGGSLETPVVKGEHLEISEVMLELHVSFETQNLSWKTDIWEVFDYDSLGVCA